MGDHRVLWFVQNDSPAEISSIGGKTRWPRARYWLYLEMPARATLTDLDGFLRDIWLECCGHLSAFDIGTVRYELDI